jgi:hypothetical protein
MKQLSIILFQLRFVAFEIPLLNIQMLKGKVIPATKGRRARPIRPFQTCSPSFSRHGMETKIMFSGNYLQQHLVHIQKEMFAIFSYPRAV